jgi:hypothetical protein
MRGFSPEFMTCQRRYDDMLPPDYDAEPLGDEQDPDDEDERCLNDY